MPKVITSDQKNRKEFKSQQKDKLEQSLVEPVVVSDEPVETVYQLPYNYSELSEAGLHTALLTNPDWKYTPASAQYVIEMLLGKEPTPPHVSFNKDRIPVNAVPIVDEPKTKVEPSDPKAPLEVEKRTRFKASLLNKFEESLHQPVVEDVPPTEITYHLPSDYAELSEAGLYKALIINPEWQYTSDSAHYVIRMLSGKEPTPSHVKFDREPVPVEEAPIVVVECKVKSEPLDPKAPQEIEKRAQFKDNLLKKVDEALVPPVIEIPKPTEITYQIPSNYEELSEAGLLSALVINPDWHYTLESAQFVVDVLVGRLPLPAHVSFNIPVEDKLSVETPKRKRKRKTSVPESPIEIEKRAEYKAGLLTKLEKTLIPLVVSDSIQEETIYQLPYNYDELSEAGLHNSLVTNSDWHYTVESAQFVVDMLSGRKPFPPHTEFNVNQPLEKVEISVERKTEKKVLSPKSPLDIKKRAQLKSNLLKKLSSLPEEEIVEAVYTAPREIQIPINFHTLSKVTLYGILTHDKGLTANGAREVIEMLDGKPSNEFTIVLEGTAIPEAIPEVTPEIRQLSIELPYNFKTFSVGQKVLWLSKESGVTPTFEEVNDVIDLLDGKPTLSGTEFNITFSDPLPLPDPIPIPDPDPEPQPQPIPEPQPDPEPEPGPIPRQEIRIPREFSDFQPLQQYLFLTKTKLLPTDIANEVIFDLKNSRFDKFDFIYEEDIIPETSPRDFTEKRDRELAVVPLEQEESITTVRLPLDFANLKESDQYWYFVTTGLSYDKANEAVRAYRGQPTKYQFEFEE